MFNYMVDKRIYKTKKALKQSLTELLDTKSFEEASVSEICDKAKISRITFYNHYKDKYDLADDIFHDLIYTGMETYKHLQRENNRQRDPIQDYLNMLESILDLYVNHNDFIKHMSTNKNSYLSYCMYTYVLKMVEMHTKMDKHMLVPKYSLQTVTSFLCYGLCGFVVSSLSENVPIEDIKKEAKLILKGILTSEIITSNNTN